MKFSLKVKTWKGALIHLAVILLLTFLIIYGFFNIYLPSYTRHGETIPVPNLENMTYEDATAELTAQSLRFQILDTAYSEKHAPGAVIRQTPRAEESVKQNRTIYLTLNTAKAPTVEFTKEMIDGIRHMDLDVLRLKLPNLHLKLGKKIPVDGFPIVYKIYYQDEEIVPGMKIPRNSSIDYALGKGNVDERGMIRGRVDSLQLELDSIDRALEVELETEDTLE